jgi:hypothetical protein
LFKGGHVPTRLRGEVDRWGDYVRLFLFCADREHGNIAVSPVDILDWPYRFFLVMSFVQQEYSRFLHETHEKEKKKMKMKKRHRGRV